MARYGPADVEIVYGGNTLDDITEVSGGEINTQTVDTTAFGDSVATQGITGVREVGDITLRGFYDPAGTSAWNRIGTPPTSVGAATTNLEIKYSNGTSRTFQVICVSRNPLPATGDQSRFEAMFKVAGATIVEDFTP